jgi:hypothetical protein
MPILGEIALNIPPLQTNTRVEANEGIPETVCRI